jgi:hypothetical protein
MIPITRRSNGLVPRQSYPRKTSVMKPVPKILCKKNHKNKIKYKLQKKKSYMSKTIQHIQHIQSQQHTLHTFNFSTLTSNEDAASSSISSTPIQKLVITQPTPNHRSSSPSTKSTCSQQNEHESEANLLSYNPFSKKTTTKKTSSNKTKRTNQTTYAAAYHIIIFLQCQVKYPGR